MTADHLHLERRYRRWLALFPREHRRVYEEEMLGVLLDSAHPGQRRPGFREAANLAMSAAVLRVRRVGTALADRPWVEACAAVGLLAPAVLAIRAGRPVVAGSAWGWRLDEPTLAPSLVWPLLPGRLTLLGWAATAVAALLGWRWVAAGGAWVTVLGVGYLLGERYLEYPVVVLYRLWPWVLGLTAAAALTVAAVVGAPRATSVLGRRASVFLGVAAGLLVASPALDPLLATVTRHGDGMSISLWPGGGGYLPALWDDGGAPYGTGLATVLAYLAVCVLALLAAARLDPPVRRRLFVLGAPAVALAIVIRLGFGGFAASSTRFSPPVLLVPVQWIVLALVPLLTLAAGIALVGRRERILRLLRVARAAQQQPPPE
jgi:hypothetical protein